MSTDQIARITKAGLDRMERDLAAEAAPAATPDPPGFELGDVVRLKSGGPAMTVTRIGDQIAVAYERNGEVIKDCFPPACLRSAQPPTFSPAPITNALGQP